MTRILKIDELYHSKAYGSRINENANSGWDGELKKFLMKNSVNGAYMEVMVDASGNVNAGVLEDFFTKTCEYCEKYRFAGIQVHPYGKHIDEGNEVNYEVSDIKANKDDVVTNCVNACRESNPGGDLTIDGCVDYICDWAKQPKMKKNVWVVFTDGEFVPKPLSKLDRVGSRVMFVVCNRGTDHLEWYNDPEYDGIQKCYIDIDHIE